tara:strand:+ start:163 stop:684 length:522 start_codon:yes stop_codon:yes gene_type:complete
MEEIIIKKISVIKTKINIDKLHLIEKYVNMYEGKFKKRTWGDNVKTSLSLCQNVLHNVVDFKDIKNEIEEQLRNYFEKNEQNIPFLINESWVNLLDKYGYQDYHTHKPAFAAGTLYINDENSDIEFATFPEDNTKKLTPKKGDLYFWPGDLHHRVMDSDKRRVSLSFNVYATQ